MFINGTPHEITIYAEVDCIFDSTSRKYFLNKDAKPIEIIPKGVPLNAQTRNIPYETEIPYLKGAIEFVSVDPLPEEEGIVIVSNLYRSALKELRIPTTNIATVGDTVYADKDNPRPVGCLSLCCG